jgi:hypothetical protein
MNIQLIVVRPFGSLARGDVIADPTRIAEILKSENAHAVVRVQAPTTRKG